MLILQQGTQPKVFDSVSHQVHAHLELLLWLSAVQIRTQGSSLPAAHAQIFSRASQNFCKSLQESLWLLSLRASISHSSEPRASIDSKEFPPQKNLPPGELGLHSFSFFAFFLQSANFPVNYLSYLFLVVLD